MQQVFKKQVYSNLFVICGKEYQCTFIREDWQSKVLKFQDFAIIWILREVNFEEFRSSKNEIELGWFRIFSLKKWKVSSKTKLRPSENVEITDFALLES